MSVQTLFEVHTLKSGSWIVDSTYPNRDTAIEVAKSLHGEKNFQAVKVIKDTFDPATGQGKEIVIFDTSSKVGRDKASPPPAASGESGTAAAAVLSSGGVPRRPPARSGNSSGDYKMALKVTLLLVLILIGGLGAIYLLHFAGGNLQRLF